MPSLHKYLDSLPDMGTRSQLTLRSADFTLDRIHFLMEALGRPERRYPSLHIAGTNGKGSVSAFCSAALLAQGYRVGRFTSPHMAGALAGITINQSPIDIAELEATFGAMRSQLEQRQDWTQFEVVTALTFAHFARAQVDAAVIEVGLGGRVDATNVMTPLVSVITPIDYDHTSILGNSLAEIASEKAGIIKPGIPVVVSPQPEEARTGIVQIALETGSQVIEVGKDITVERISSDLSGQVFKITSPLEKGRGIEFKIPMLGAHQVENAATAFAALQVADRGGLAVSEASIRRGLAAARWPGRFEVVQTDPLVVLDAAHTPAAAQVLRAGLDEYFPGKSVVMVLGVSADKDLAGIIEPLRPRIVRVIATQSPHPRAMPVGELQRKLSDLRIETDFEINPQTALRRAIGSVGKEEVVLVCGSVFLVEAIGQSFTQ